LLVANKIDSQRYKIKQNWFAPDTKKAGTNFNKK